MAGRSRSWFVLLAAVVGGALAFAWSSREPLPEARALEGELDLGHGVKARRVEARTAPLAFVVVSVPRRKGLALRAVQARGLKPLGDLAASVGALAAINGDYHELGGPLLGRTYSTLVEGGDPDDLARYRNVGTPDTDDASFWLDADRVPRISHLDVGASLGLAVNLSQGLHHRCGDIDLIAEPAAGKHTLTDAVAFPVARDGAGWRVTGPSAKSFSGPALVVLARDIAAVATAVAPGVRVQLSVSQRVNLAIGTAPQLVSNGAIPRLVFDGEARWSRFARTAVGITPDAILLVASVREPHDSPSMVELAKFMLELGCTDALNLDGGPSTSMWAAGKLVNVEPERAGLVNAVGSALCVVAGDEKTDVR